MSTISVSNIETANGSEPLTLKTGNTAAGDIVIGAGGGVVIASNSSVNTITANSIGSYFTGNVSIDSLLANGSLGTLGQILTSNASSIYWGALSALGSVSVNAITSGSTYTRPTGLVSALVIATGAGGGGGGSDSDGSGAAGGSGGGAGGTAIRIYTAAELGATASYAIGAGGTAGSATGGNAGAGGNTTFTPSGGGTALDAAGGGAGVGSTGVSDNTRTAGAVGGIPTGGQINVDGGDGVDGITASSGASAGVPAAIGGLGGASFWGGGGRGSAVPAASAGVGGLNGAAFGTGAGGSATSDNTTGAAGGTGAQGVIFILEFKQ
jgi:hypothetical protein